MPGLNGFQATRAITREEKTKHIPVIICTTKDQETDKIWGLRQGAKDYVTKPVDESELLEKIEELSAARLNRTRRAPNGTPDSLREFQLSVAERLRRRRRATHVAAARLPGRRRATGSWRCTR